MIMLSGMDNEKLWKMIKINRLKYLIKNSENYKSDVIHKIIHSNPTPFQFYTLSILHSSNPTLSHSYTLPILHPSNPPPFQ